MSDTIDVTGIDRVAFAKAVYELSVPQGLGFIEATSKPLSNEEAEAIANAESFSMDYVGGRACKMHIRDESGRSTISDRWYDHTDEQYDKLLAQFGLSRAGNTKHTIACNCSTCAPNSSARNPEAVLSSFPHDSEIRDALMRNEQFQEGRVRN